MKLLAIVGGVALAAALSNPAEAADFTGPRVEVHAGWERLGVADPALKLDDREDGIVYGVGVGYDVALGKRLVAGLEADFDLADTEFERVAGNTRVEARARRDIALSARLGARLGDRLLLYGKAGYTNARIAGVLIANGTAGTTREEFAANGDGLRLGAGVEFALGAHAYAKSEYRYSNYESDVTRHQLLAGFGYRF